MSKASLELGGGNWAAKDGKLLGYAVGDTSGKYLPREFTFSRGADIAATRVNKDGLIEKYRENLLLQSNQFDTTWLTADCTVTGGQSGYDGSSDAWKLENTGSSLSYVRQSSLSVSGLQTLSFYAKAGNVDWLRANALLSGTNANNYFNIASGTIGASPSPSVITSSITEVATGWYRISLTYNDTVSEIRIHIADGDGDEYPPLGSYIYIQDAQLEAGLVATDYLESDDETGKAGVLDNLPRIDYTSGSAQLLMEPERKNLVPYSENLGNIAWNKTRCTIDDNDTISPEGVVNGAKMISTDPSESYIQDVLTTTQTKVAWSFWAKKGDLDYVHGLLWDTSANGCRQWFNVSTGAVGGSTSFGSGYSVDSASIEEYGNGWWRCVMIVNCPVGDQGCRVNISDGNTLTTSATNSYGYFYGLQLEDASYATSYIPNYGTALGVTRNADTCTTTPSNLISSQLFSMFFEHTPTGGGFSGSTPAFELNIQGTSDNVSFYVNNSGIDDGLNIYLGPTNGGYIWGTGTNDGWTVNQKSKVALTYDGDNLRYFINGVLHNSQTGVSFTDADTSLYITHAKGNKVEQALVFPTALTDQEAIAITTL